MKKLKVFLCLIAVFAITIGINVNAEVEQWRSEMNIVLPIHKTDEAGKGLEGAIFTLKDFNGTISYSSSDYKNGDYLIEVYKENEDVLDKNINLLPSNYKELITGIKSWEDVQNLTKRDDLLKGRYYSDDDDNYVYISFFIPLKLEESVVPAGYQKEDFVVLGLVEFEFDRYGEHKREDIEARSEYFDEFLDNGIAIHSSLVVYETPDFLPGYFKYDSSKDYDSLFVDLNKKIKTLQNGPISSQEEYDELMNNMQKIFEEADYNTKDVKCPEVAPRPLPNRENFEDVQFSVAEESAINPYCIRGGHLDRENIEARFDDIVENCYCVIQLKNKKENIVVNPQTASTLGIISLITLGSIGFITAKKLRKNN